MTFDYKDRAKFGAVFRQIRVHESTKKWTKVNFVNIVTNIEQVRDSRPTYFDLIKQFEELLLH